MNRDVLNDRGSLGLSSTNVGIDQEVSIQKQGFVQ